MRCARMPMGVVVAIALGIVVAGASAATKRSRDTIWTRPDFATLKVDRIAQLPATSYDNNFQNESEVEASLALGLKTTGYRWVSASTTRELMRSKTGGDSLLKVLGKGVLATARLDSLHAPKLAAMLRCNAILTVRIEQYEQHEPEWNASGKPITSVRLRAALVDSAGRLLWTAAGTETGEGPYRDASAPPVAVNDTGLERKAVTGQGGAPSFREVLALIASRWADQFPPKPVAAPADSAASRH